MSFVNRLGGIACVFTFCLFSASSYAETVYAVTSENRIIRFDSLTPQVIESQTQVTGLFENELIVGLDYRASTGQLYAFTDQDRIYTISYTTGEATVVGPGVIPPPTGSSFGFDFNPRVDLIRLVSDVDENYRIDPNTGLTVNVDTPLSYIVGDVNFGQNPNVVAVAYTRNNTTDTVTTLYGIDSNRDTLVRIGGLDTTPSPNTGTLTTVGPLGVDTTALANLDVSPLDPLGGVAFATLSPTSMDHSSLYLVNLLTGTATLIGEIGIDSRIAGMTVIPDVDSDGIPDIIDLCPTSTPGTVVSEDGCPTTSVLQANLAGLWVSATEKCKISRKGTKCQIKGQFAVANNGRTDAPPTVVNFYVSDDALFGPNDVPIYSKNITLKAGKLKKIKVKFKSTEELLPGRYVIAVIDEPNLVQEYDETDNVEVYGRIP